MRLSPYSVLMLAGVLASLALWSRLAKRDERLLVIYICSLIGAFTGAKLVYLLSEGWLHLGEPGMWLQLATGKTILGALLGGYAAVAFGKRLTGYTAVTGDLFATIVPAAVIIGRVGCLLQGCCQGTGCPPAWYALPDAHGVPRWPAVPVEMLFNALALAAFGILRRTRRLAGQHFHLYLMGYGAFRFAHEFLRDTPHFPGGWPGYQIASLAVFGLGLVGFERRRKHPVAAFR
jgi:phosphatidylglycerol:prolipoprotein diacylglycerol transferase